VIALVEPIDDAECGSLRVLDATAHRTRAIDDEREVEGRAFVVLDRVRCDLERRVDVPAAAARDRTGRHAGLQRRES
jgi:hypothetical protein